MNRVMLFIACGLIGSSALADPCDDYAHAVDKYIQAIRQSGRRLDEATDAHQFADAVNLFASATEELTATLRQLSPQLTALSQSRNNASQPTCERAQERLVAFSAELNAIGTKLADQAQKYISDPEVQQAFDRLRKLRFDTSQRELRRSASFSSSSSSFRLRQRPVVERASLARPTSSGGQHRARASSDRTSASSVESLSSNPVPRSDGVME
jgi:primosomal protein N''